MKSLYHLLFFPMIASIALVAPNAMAQYTLHVDSGQAYTEISNPTYEIPDHSPYFGNVNTKPDLVFKAFSQQYDLSVNVFIPIKEGYCYFDNGGRSTTVYACKGDYVKRPGQASVFSFKTDTSNGNRKFIMQWKNMGVLNGHDSDYLNFQVWLYEKNGMIEFRYGDCKVRPGLFENGANGPTIGLLEMNADFTTIYNQLWLKGRPLSPGIDKTSTLINLNQEPANGTVYRWTNDLSNVIPILEPSKLSIYPNPVTNTLYFHGPSGAEIRSALIYDIHGQSLETPVLTDGAIDVSGLSRGLYIIKLADQAGMEYSCRFMKH